MNETKDENHMIISLYVENDWKYATFLCHEKNVEHMLQGTFLKMIKVLYKKCKCPHFVMGNTESIFSKIIDETILSVFVTPVHYSISNSTHVIEWEKGKKIQISKDKFYLLLRWFLLKALKIPPGNS